jgi:hypothetical protein
MPSEPHVERVNRLLGSFPSDHGFSVHTGDDQTNTIGAWVRLESGEFLIDVVRDRGQEWITVTTKVRAKPRAPLRG